MFIRRFRISEAYADDLSHTAIVYTPASRRIRRCFAALRLLLALYGTSQYYGAAELS